VTTRQDLRGDSAVRSGGPLLQVLARLVMRPEQLLLLWNWKSAWLSIILRGPIFLAASIGQGIAGTVAAVGTECAFCALTAGFYGALVQNVRDATPEWLTGVFLALVVPAVFQLAEFGLHWLRGTPHLVLAELVSLVISAVSSLFNWYAMRRGALLVGGEGGSFRSDLLRLPRLFWAFIVTIPRHLRNAGKGFAISMPVSRQM
jgi:hypothetical protein